MSKFFVRLTQAMLVLLMLFVLLLTGLITFSNVWFRVLAEWQKQEPGTMVYVFLYIAAALALWLLIELFAITSTAARDPFSMKNVRALMRCGLISICAALLFGAKCLFTTTPMTVAVAAVMLLAGMFAIVLAGVFKKAVLYKQENDLTV